MEFEIKYQGKCATCKEIDFVKQLIAENPNVSRRSLSQKLCREWNWIQPNGQLRDMVCRGFLLKLERAGCLKLPPKKCNPNNPLLNRSKPEKIEIDETPIVKALKDLDCITLNQVRRTPSEKLFNSIIDQYHYLGYTHPVGESLKYIAYSDERPIAFFSWSSAPRHLAGRDKFIGWSSEIRKKNIDLISYNSRFFIPNWIQVRFLASYLLGKMTKVLSSDWESIYNHPILFAETFIDTEKFPGTCYKAANWIYLGKTTGRGKNTWIHKPNRSIKAIWGYPLRKNYRKLVNA